MEHTQLPVNNCPMLKAGLCRLSLTKENPDFQTLKEISEIRTENERLKEILQDYMRTMRKMAGQIWDTKTAVSMHRILGQMEKDVAQALQGKTKDKENQ